MKYFILGLVWGACAVLALEINRELNPHCRDARFELHSDEQRAAWMDARLGETG